MLARIGIVVLVVVVGLLAFIATRPGSFHVERSARIDTSPDVVFALINDFHQWSRWSPWERIDPDMKRTFTGPSAGPGASYAWSGSGEIGKGQMTIVDSKPDEFVAIKLEFFEPVAATNQVRFELAPSNSGTRVGWSMDGQNGFVAKAIALFFDMDSMVGSQFEKGLASLDAAAQAETQRGQGTAGSTRTSID